MTSDIIRLIEQYESAGSFTYAAVSDDKLYEAEKRLSVELPDQYKAFLRRYGHGGLDGFEVIGVAKNGKLLFVDVTMLYRQHGLPNQFIVIEDCDEWIYCIDCNAGSVVYWEHGEVAPAFDCFDAYLMDRLNDSIENR